MTGINSVLVLLLISNAFFACVLSLVPKTALDAEIFRKARTNYKRVEREELMEMLKSGKANEIVNKLMSRLNDVSGKHSIHSFFNLIEKAVKRGKPLKRIPFKQLHNDFRLQIGEPKSQKLPLTLNKYDKLVATAFVGTEENLKACFLNLKAFIRVNLSIKVPECSRFQLAACLHRHKRCKGDSNQG